LTYKCLDIIEYTELQPKHATHAVITSLQLNADLLAVFMRVYLLRPIGLVFGGHGRYTMLLRTYHTLRNRLQFTSTTVFAYNLSPSAPERIAT
jgi:hypothetical protein